MRHDGPGGARARGHDGDGDAAPDLVRAGVFLALLDAPDLRPLHEALSRYDRQLGRGVPIAVVAACSRAAEAVVAHMAAALGAV